MYVTARYQHYWRSGDIPTRNIRKDYLKSMYTSICLICLMADLRIPSIWAFWWTWNQNVPTTWYAKKPFMGYDSRKHDHPKKFCYTDPKHVFIDNRSNLYTNIWKYLTTPMPSACLRIYTTLSNSTCWCERTAAFVRWKSSSSLFPISGHCHGMHFNHVAKEEAGNKIGGKT